MLCCLYSVSEKMSLSSMKRRNTTGIFNLRKCKKCFLQLSNFALLNYLVTVDRRHYINFKFNFVLKYFIILNYPAFVFIVNEINNLKKYLNWFDNEIFSKHFYSPFNCCRNIGIYDFKKYVCRFKNRVCSKHRECIASSCKITLTKITSQ